MTYKQIPFTLEEWQKDPKGRKVVHADGRTALFVHYNKDTLEYLRIVIVWDDSSCGYYGYNELRLRIPVKTVRKWRNWYEECAGEWYTSKQAAEYKRLKNCYAIESAEFDEEGNYVKGTVKVEEV